MKPGLADVPGYSYSAIECGIRYSNRLDFCLIAAEHECNAAGVFTTNRVCAAPVTLCRERINQPIRGILINATNANACTGAQGLEDARKLTAKVASELACPQNSILNSSTGIIGVPLPAEKMLSRIPDLVSNLTRDNGTIIPKAIMTTDTRPKQSGNTFSTSAGTFTIAGTAKGAGMIAPNMATLLCYTVTNAPVAKADLDQIFKRCIEHTLNSIIIDGDTSTNDSAIILAASSSDSLQGEDLAVFERALYEVLDDLSHQLVADAEGGTRCVTVEVSGAHSADDARKVANSISRSLLVKTAFFGNDPNWGRIACAAGYAGVEFDASLLSVSINDKTLLKLGTPTGLPGSELQEIMHNPEYTVYVSIGNGPCSWKCLTSDISYEYVKINAEYTT